MFIISQFKYVYKKQLIKIMLYLCIAFYLIYCEIYKKYLSIMQKSKSQSAIPTKPPKKQFICQIQDDSYYFQTKDIFMRLQFFTPLKQIYDYLQQYQKYTFLSQISSIGIKSYEQKQFYERIKNKINNKYEKYLQKTMMYIQQLMMNLLHMKIQLWHYYTQLVHGYKTNLLNRDIDCYQYQTSQFQPYRTKVMQYLNNIHNQHNEDNEGKNKQIKIQIKANQKLIRNKIQDIQDDMFVKNPFKPQNIKKIQIQSDQVFDQYFKNIIYGTVQLQQGFDIRFHNAYDGIQQFMQYIKQYSIRGQKLASMYIKQYNKNIKDKKIKNDDYMQIKQKKSIDINDYQNEWKKSNKLLPALVNSIQRVNISKKIIYKDQNTSDTFTISIKNKQDNQIKFVRNQQGFSNRIPMNNPYFDYFAHKYDRDRLRKLHLYYEQPTKNKQMYAKKYYADRYRIRINKQKIYIQHNYHIKLVNQRQNQQKIIWSIYKKQNQTNNRFLYQIDQPIKKNQFYVTNKNNNLTQLQQQHKIIQQYKSYQQKLEKQHKNQDQMILIGLKKNNKQKNYKQFVAKFGIKDAKRQCTNVKIMRYGIQISRKVLQNKDIGKLQQFLCSYYRQLLFRHFDKYNDKQSIPLILNPKPAQQFCNLKTIKKLGQLTQTFKRYFVWCSQIIKYQQITTVNKQKIGKFTIYAYSKVKNSQSLLFQLKKRLNFKVRGQIIQCYNFGQPCIQAVMSKLQIMHRLIFNQHMQTPNSQLSYLKGLQIYNIIIKQLSNENKNQLDHQQ